MTHDPTLFINTTYETANESVLFCQEVLENAGHYAYASQLGSFTPLNDAETARGAYRLLTEMKARVKDGSAEYIGIALYTVERALTSAPQLRDVA